MKVKKLSIIINTLIFVANIIKSQEYKFVNDVYCFAILNFMCVVMYGVILFTSKICKWTRQVKEQETIIERILLVTLIVGSIILSILLLRVYIIAIYEVLVFLIT